MSLAEKILRILRNVEPNEIEKAFSELQRLVRRKHADNQLSQKLCIIIKNVIQANRLNYLGYYWS